MAHIEGFEGVQYHREGTQPEQQDYAYFNQQYATTTYQKEHEMYPSLIVRPKGDDDVVAAVKWAKQNKVAMAIKSGGHQYSGASSTSGKNIQLDLSNTYKDLMVVRSTTSADQNKTLLVYVGVSTHLQDLNAYLQQHKLFVPHGLCAYVCVGGHAQTGGYGQLCRSFGLFGDHVRTIRLVGHDAVIRDVTKANDPDLFYAVLGGSPGNFGVVTHFTLEAHRAQSYVGALAGPNGFKGPHAIRGLWIYSDEVLRELLSKVVAMADDPAVPRGFDLCVSVLSSDFPVTYTFPELNNASVWDKVQDKIKDFFASKFLDWLNGSFPAHLAVYAQWCPTEPGDRYDENVDKWFKQFRDLDSLFKDQVLLIKEMDYKDEYDMSKLTGVWIFPKEREFDLPYVKRAYSTNSHTLGQDGWIDEIVERIDQIYNPKHFLSGHEGGIDHDRFLHCKLAVQIQCIGGTNSMLVRNADNGASFSWRDSTVMAVVDCFHDDDEEAKKYADEWQAENDRLMAGPDSRFSKTDRRWLWNAHGDWDLSKESVWPKYYESRAKYEALSRARAKADPDATFTPNPFAVPREV
ncbi:FAD binding domain-containing protein [Xylariomycetidae sp. FL0641]|nr:FAD binding domain-containing protein [Xylariomycetidae sp. FL0641]